MRKELKSKGMVLAAFICLAFVGGLLLVTFANVVNSQKNCKELERIKTAERASLIKNYANLDKNALLLGIRVTPALRKAELKFRDEGLVEFQSHKCTGIFG